MAYLNSNAHDNGLTWLDTNLTRIDVCSQEPTTYTEATSTYTLGTSTVNTGAPQAGSPDGRKVAVPAIAGASITGSGTASHWAGSDGAAVLCATSNLSAAQALTSGNTFGLAAIDLAFRDPT